MKKIIILMVSFIAFAATASAQKSGMIADILKHSAEEKVTKLQTLIQFDDTKAEQLKILEFQFLLDVQKAETCCWCNTKKRIEKLKNRRDADLQQILSQDEYIKYDAVDSGRIKKHTQWAE